MRGNKLFSMTKGTFKASIAEIMAKVEANEISATQATAALFALCDTAFIGIKKDEPAD